MHEMIVSRHFFFGFNRSFKTTRSGCVLYRNLNLIERVKRCEGCNLHPKLHRHIKRLSVNGRKAWEARTYKQQRKEKRKTISDL